MNLPFEIIIEIASILDLESFLKLILVNFKKLIC